jgi:phage gp36-like protein
MALYGTRLPRVYTSRDEINDSLSEYGVDLRLDDLITGDADVMLSICEKATARVQSIMRKAFDDIDLANSVWVRERATIIAVYLLSTRRGNPGLLRDQYEEAMVELEMAVSGDLYVDLARSSDTVAVMQNVNSDNRFPFTPMRVDPLTSTKLVDGQFYRVITYPLAWL